MRYKLSDCITIISGGTPKKSQESYWNGNIPWITVKDVNGKYVSTTTDFITLEGLKHSSANLTEDQDILISARGTVGKVLMVGAGYTFNQSIYCLRTDRSVLVPDYLFYWLEKNVSLVKQGTHGSVFETITKDTFNHLTIDLPDLKEQYQIAHKLSMFDRKINLNEQINDNLLETCKTNLHQLINEKEYEVTQIGNLDLIVSDHVANGSFKSLKDSVKYFDEPNFATFLRNIDLKNRLDGNLKYIDETSYNFLKKSHLFGGEVVISNVADVGSVHRVPRLKHPMVVGNNQIFIRSKNQSMNDYLFIFFNSKWGQHAIHSITSGSAQQKFNKTDFKKLNIPIPTDNWVDNHISPFLKMTDLNKAETRLLKRIKSSLLNKYF